MSAPIEQRVEDLLAHAEVWDETKETLRDLLADHKAGKLDPDDARYIEGLHRKMFSGRSGAPPQAKQSSARPRDLASVRPANDDAGLRSRRAGLSPEEIMSALRLDLADLIAPGDLGERPVTEQALRKDLLEALHATLDQFDGTKED